MLASTGAKRRTSGLKRTRGLSFGEVVSHIRQGDLLAADDHPNQARYPGQIMIVVNIKDYAHLVPAVRANSGYFLKTVIPNRKATRQYLSQ